MRTTFSDELERSRKLDGHFASLPGEHNGVFYIMRVRTQFVVIASDGADDIPWEHVSARAKDWSGGRTPTWEEMCWLKYLFWEDEECVVQFHPPKSEYVNNHPHVLHLWRYLPGDFPRPPSIAVGIKWD